jgi:glycosyltransferase involved in cell wall biosynthesis
MTKLKILTVTPFFLPDVGGLSTHVQSINANLIKEGNDVTIIAPKHLGIKIKEQNKIFSKIYKMDSIYLPGWPYPTLRSMSIPIDLGSKIKSVIRNGNYDIIHIHGHHFPTSWIAINAAHRYGVTSVLTMHGMYALNPNVLGGKSIIENGLNKYVFTKILSKTNGIIGLTEHITDYAKQLGKDSTKYFTIPNGINTELFKKNLSKKMEYRKKYNVDQNRKVVLFCGRFEKGKGIIEFAEAAKRIVKKSESEVVIVGRGALGPQVKSIIGNSEHIHLFDWQPQEQIHELYIASDVFILPSRFEALPLTIIEAMNAGLHVVYTLVGGVSEILEGYSAKTILSKISIDEIENIVLKVIENFEIPNNIKELLGYAQKFDWGNVSIDTAKAYAECINEKYNVHNRHIQ